jgi:hypothetical protein
VEKYWFLNGIRMKESDVVTPAEKLDPKEIMKRDNVDERWRHRRRIAEARPSARTAAAADAETPEAAAAEVAQVEAVEPAAKPETADIKVDEVAVTGEKKTVSTDEPEAKADETFLSKYGMYIGGAVVLGGAAYFFRDSLGFGSKQS